MADLATFCEEDDGNMNVFSRIVARNWDMKIVKSGEGWMMFCQR